VVVSRRFGLASDGCVSCMWQVCGVFAAVSNLCVAFGWLASSLSLAS
jgi:hypothetical protein